MAADRLKKPGEAGQTKPADAVAALFQAVPCAECGQGLPTSWQRARHYLTGQRSAAQQAATHLHGPGGAARGAGAILGVPGEEQAGGAQHVSTTML